MRRERGEDVRVDIVDANEVVLHQHLAFFGCWDWQISLIFKHLDAAGLLDNNAFHGFWD